MNSQPLKTPSGNFIGIKGTNKIIGKKKPRQSTHPSKYPKPKSYIAQTNNWC